jgi:hypothetical protein
LATEVCFTPGLVGLTKLVVYKLAEFCVGHAAEIFFAAAFVELAANQIRQLF